MTECLPFVTNFTVWILFYFQVVECIRVKSVWVPSSVSLGRGAVLKCRWDLEGDTLYSLKWYKDGEEFIRVSSSGNHPVSFDIPGIHVNVDRSNTTHVVLVRTDVNSSGIYRCEATGEAPRFATDMKEAKLSVIALPRRGPIIFGGKGTYRAGDEVNLTCVAGPSFPRLNLTWFINGQLVEGSYIKGPYVTKNWLGLETTSLEIFFRVDHSHLSDGQLKVKCLATIATIYWNSSDINNKTTNSTTYYQNNSGIVSGLQESAHIYWKYLLSIFSLQISSIFFSI